MKTLVDVAIEGSTYVVSCTFKDENGVSFTPATDVTWTLYSDNGYTMDTGTVSAAATTNIILTDDTLDLGEAIQGEQALTLVISTTYDSANGSGLSLVDSVNFMCRNVHGH